MKYLAFLLFFLPLTTLSLPCPQGGGILYKGDTIAQVIQQCGEPNSKETMTKQLSSTKEWIYYKGHAFDQGSTQMIVLFNNEKVANIHLTERYPYIFCQQGIVQVGAFITTQTSCGNWSTYTTYTTFCGWGFGVGATATYVESICGQPANQVDLQNQTQQETRFYYTGDNSLTILFRDGKIIEFN